MGMVGRVLSLCALLLACARQGAYAFLAPRRGHQGSSIQQLRMAQTTSRFRPTGLPPTQPPPGRIPFSCNVLNSGVINIAPWLELHHVVMLSVSSPEATGAFAIDFSPFDQTNPETILKLFKNQNVPAEIRIKWVPKTSRFKDLKELKRTWACMGSAGNLELEAINDKLKEITNAAELEEDYKVLLKVIERVQRKWSCSMNLYSHNCQHFSAYVREMVRSDAVCEISYDQLTTSSQ